MFKSPDEAKPLDPPPTEGTDQEKSVCLMSFPFCWTVIKCAHVFRNRDSRVVRSLTYPTNVAWVWFPEATPLCGLSLLLFLILVQRVFLLVLQVFLPPQKPTFPNSNLIWKCGSNSHLVDSTEIPIYLFIYFHIYQALMILKNYML